LELGIVRRFDQRRHRAGFVDLRGDGWPRDDAAKGDLFMANLWGGNGLIMGCADARRFVRATVMAKREADGGLAIRSTPASLLTCEPADLIV
jgi:hypothetical protein